MQIAATKIAPVLIRTIAPIITMVVLKGRLESYVFLFFRQSRFVEVVIVDLVLFKDLFRAKLLSPLHLGFEVERTLSL